MNIKEKSHSYKTVITRTFKTGRFLTYQCDPMLHVAAQVRLPVQGARLHGPGDAEAEGPDATPGERLRPPTGRIQGF